MRSVSSTMMLLILLMYVFGIIFVTNISTDPDVGERYDTIPEAMWTLLLGGAVIDNITDVANNLRAAAPGMAAAFVIFMVMAFVMTMQMLIGILCEVIAAVAEA